MKASLVSSSGRAATFLCASCRREAMANQATRTMVSRAVFSTATPVMTASQQTARVATLQPIRRNWNIQTSPATQRWSSTGTSSSTSSPITPPATVPTYYALFPETLPHGPPPAGKFHIDLRALHREFLRLQAASHPDFHHHAASSSSSSSSSTTSSPSDTAGAPPQKSSARLHAEATSALINAAYKTLRSPLLRAQYILQTQHGIDLEGDETGAHVSARQKADPELLMTVLEAREAIEEAQREEDLDELRAANDARVAESEDRVGAALEAGDVEGAKEEVVRLRYWMAIREGLDNWEKGKGVVLHH
ncbi:hypothetical protein VTK26DRAFT_6760 [Humicola hyalothermophila]